MTASEARRILRARPGTYSADLVTDSRAVLSAPRQTCTDGDAEARTVIAELRALALSLRAYSIGAGSVDIVAHAREEARL